MDSFRALTCPPDHIFNRERACDCLFTHGTHVFQAATLNSSHPLSDSAFNILRKVEQLLHRLNVRSWVGQDAAMKVVALGHVKDWQQWFLELQPEICVFRPRESSCIFYNNITCLQPTALQPTQPIPSPGLTL